MHADDVREPQHCSCNGCRSQGATDDPSCLYVWALTYAQQRGASTDVAETFEAYVTHERDGVRVYRPTASYWRPFLTVDRYGWHDEMDAEELQRLRASLPTG